MRVLEVSFRDFRNLENAILTPGDGLNLLYGENAQGKTNCLEGIWLFAAGRSFRVPSDKEMISLGKDSAGITLKYADARRENTLSVGMNYGRGRTYRANGVPIRSGTDFIGTFRAVLFAPEHIALVRGGPAERRAFLDTALCQLKPVYLSSLQKYNLILSQRNALLKSAAEKKPESFDLTMSVWSAQLAREAVYIASERAAYVNSLTRFVSPFFADLSGGKEEISLSYSHLYTEEEYLTKLTINIEREIAAGATLYGIHKDDVAITLNGKEARFFASQGQQRSIAFALKLGEGKIAEETGGDSPIYLMDDVLSELDAERRSFVLSSLRGKQTFVTTCIPDDFAGVPAERFRVKNGNIIPAAP